MSRSYLLARCVSGVPVDKNNVRQGRGVGSRGLTSHVTLELFHPCHRPIHVNSWELEEIAFCKPDFRRCPLCVRGSDCGSASLNLNLKSKKTIVACPNGHCQPHARLSTICALYPAQDEMRGLLNAAETLALLFADHPSHPVSPKKVELGMQ